MGMAYRILDVNGDGYTVEIDPSFGGVAKYELLNLFPVNSLPKALFGRKRMEKW